MKICPCSGRNSPINNFNKVDLPEPLPPIITKVSPLLTSKLILFKINLSLKDLYMLTTFIIIPPQR